MEVLKEKVSAATHGEYTLSIGDLSISFLSRSIVVSNLVLAPTEQNITHAKAVYIIKANKVRVSAIAMVSYFRDHELNIDRIEFEEPQISIFQGSERALVKDPNIVEKPLSLYKSISSKLTSVTIDHIDIINSKFNIYAKASDTLALLAANENSISIAGFQLNETCDKMGRLFLAQKFEIVMNKFSYHLPKGLYTVFGKKLYASYTDSLLKVDSLQVIPNFSKKEFGKAADQQISRVSLVANKVEFTRFDVKRFLEMNWMLAEKLNASGVYIDVFRDNNIPLKPINRPSLQALFRDVPIYLSIDTIRLSEADASYEEIAEGATEPGIMKLGNIRGVITGVNNDSTLFTDDSKITAIVDAEFMQKSHFHLKSDFPLNTRANVFYSSGSLSSMPLSDINPLIEKAKGVKVLSGVIDSMKFNFSANDTRSSGKMTFAYHDLEVKLKEEENEKKFKRKLKNFIVNDVILRQSNPGKDGRLREVSIGTDRNPYRYFPYYTMQTILSGIAASMQGEQKAKLLKRSRLLEKK
ncbi:MAG: hypothetical protein K0Q95_2748 [Bacteroidota bacterium]|nr:hypothetical protein [Bacteroidota bacterium]